LAYVIGIFFITPNVNLLNKKTTDDDNDIDKSEVTVTRIISIEH